MSDLVIFLVLAGVALLVKLVGNAHESQGTDSETPAAPNEKARSLPPLRAPAESEQERVRRFLEALGVPEGSAPPPPVRPRPAAPRRVITPVQKQEQVPKAKRSWAQPLPPLVSTPEDVTEPPPLVMVPVPEPEPEPLASPLLEPVAPLTPALLPVARRSPPSPRPVTSKPLSLGEMLRTSGSARQAMVLREVLGPPRALQSLEVATARG